MNHPQTSRTSANLESPTARELAMVLFRQGRILIVVFCIVFLLAIVYAVGGTSYRARLQILMRRGRSDPPATGQPNAPPDFSRVEVSEEELNSEVELLKDDDVLRRVAGANNLPAHDWLRWLRPHEEQAAKLERAARKLSSQLDVIALKKTNVIAVTYEASDPDLAAHVLQSLASLYLEKHTQVRRPGGEFQFFDEQTAESRRQLESAERKLLDFNNAHGIVMAAQQRDLILQRLNDVEAGFRQTQLQMSDAGTRIFELRAQLGQLPERTITQVRTADNPELMRALKGSLLDLELKKTQLLTKFEPTHRLVQEVDRQIGQAKDAIANEKLSPLRDETTDQDVNYEWARAELEKAEVEKKALEARQATAIRQLSEYRSLARELGENAVIQDDLTSSEKAAQENYLLYVKKREEARMSDALDQGGIVNVAIAQKPVVPAIPLWPPVVVVFVGFAGALVSGIGAAFAADYLDPALRTPEEVFACLEIPVLASLPEKTGRRLSA